MLGCHRWLAAFAVAVAVDVRRAPPSLIDVAVVMCAIFDVGGR